MSGLPNRNGSITSACLLGAVAMWALNSEQRHSIRVTASIGLLLSVVFFLAISTVLGSIAALLFYNPPRESRASQRTLNNYGWGSIVQS